MARNTVEIIISALDRFTPVFDKMSNEIQQLEKKYENLTNALDTTGKVFVAAGVATAGGMGLAVKASADFGAMMSKVAALSGATGEQFEKLRQQAIDLGGSTSFSASQVAEGMQMLAAAGMTSNQIMDAMSGVLSAAAASGEDMALVADTMASALNAFGLGASEASHVADVLAQAANMSAIGVQDMAYSLKYVGPVANAVGISLEEVSAALVGMGNAGIKGEQAGTTLRGALIRLVDPPKEAADAIAALGISITDTSGNMLPLGNIIGQLQEKTKGMTEAQKAQALASIFGIEAVSGMMVVIDGGKDKFDQYANSLINSTGAAEETAKIMKDNLKGALDELQGATESAAISVGDALTPAIKTVAEALTGFIQRFNALPEPMKNTIATTAAATAALMLFVGPVLILLGQLPAAAVALKAMAKSKLAVATAAQIAAAKTAIFKAVLTANPIGIVVSAIGLLVAGLVTLYKTNDTARYYMQQAWSSVKIGVLSAIDSILGALQSLVQFVPGLADKISSYRDQLSNMVDSEKVTRSVRDANRAYARYADFRKIDAQSIAKTDEDANRRSSAALNQTTAAIDFNTDAVKENKEEKESAYQQAVKIFDHQVRMGELTEEQQLNELERIKDLAEAEDERWDVEERIHQLRKRMLEEEERLREKARQERIDEANRLNDALMSALRQRYQSERDARIRAIDQELEDERRKTDQIIEEYERQYQAKVDQLDRETAAQLDAVQNQLDAISAEEEAEREAKHQRELAEKLADIEQKKQKATTAEELLKLQEEEHELLAEERERQREKEREERREKLREEMDDIRSHAQQKKDQLKAELEEKINHEQAMLTATEDRLTKEREGIQAHYDQLLSAASLAAESHKLIQEDSQEEILALLKEFEPQWFDQGKSFGEKLIEGFKSTNPAQAISSAIGKIKGKSSGGGSSGGGGSTPKDVSDWGSVDDMLSDPGLSESTKDAIRKTRDQIKASRYHGGGEVTKFGPKPLAPNEVPVIAKEGEVFIDRDSMMRVPAMAGMGGPAVIVNMADMFRGAYILGFKDFEKQVEKAMDKLARRLGKW